MVRFLVSTTEEMHRDMKKWSESKGQTLSGLIRGILWDWMQEQSEAEEGTDKGGQNDRHQRAIP